MSTESTAVGSLTLAGLLGAAPFGVPIETMAIGSLFTVLGVLGRGAFELQKVAQGTGTMRFAQILGWMGAGFLGAPFMAVVVMIILKLANAQLDNYTLVGFLAMGFFGPRALNLLINLAKTQLKKRFNINFDGVQDDVPKP